MFERIEAKDFDEVYAIMEQSFPTDERRPYEEQRQLLCREEYRILVSRDGGGKISSFIAAWELDGLLFIEHFATAPEYRGQGVGGRLLDEVVSHSSNPVCLEVEPPLEEIQSRRVEFYRRHGFFLNEYPYIQPPISRGRVPVPLMIMTTDGEIPADEFESVRSQLYRKVYNVID
jgi:ribosomal protein S18 acetylase RimI-like enzyme